jgi:dethiobiotin synthetase
MKSKSLFITGTDTGVGKTLVTGGLAACFREAGMSVGVMKPAETGCRPHQGTRMARDAAFLRQMSGTADSMERIAPYRLLAPLAPLAAAQREGIRIRVPRIVSRYREIAARHEITLVEGAGGLLVPYTARARTLELIVRLDLPVVVVGRTGLGTINHTLLTLDVLARSGVRVLGVILNNADGSRGPAERTNPDTLRRWTRVPLLGTIPYRPGLRATRGSREQIVRLIRSHVNADLLLQRI